MREIIFKDVQEKMQELERFIKNDLSNGYEFRGKGTMKNLYQSYILLENKNKEKAKVTYFYDDDIFKVCTNDVNNSEWSSIEVTFKIEKVKEALLNL